MCYTIYMEVYIRFNGEKPSEIAIDGKAYDVGMEKDDTMVGKAWIAKYLGVSVRALYQKPWFFPDFGESIKGTRCKPYTASEIKEWLAIPLQVRKRMYKEYLNNKE